MPIAEISSFAEFGLDLREKPKTRVAGRTAKPNNVVKQQLAIKLRAGRQVSSLVVIPCWARTASVPANPPKDVE
jgi:hypothetical protein